MSYRLHATFGKEVIHGSTRFGLLSDAIFSAEQVSYKGNAVSVIDERDGSIAYVAQADK